MKVKRKWLVFVGVVISAVVTFFSVSGGGNSRKTKQKNVAGDNQAAARDINQPKRDNIQADGNVTINNVEGDTSKAKPNVTITTYHQSGGITAQNVIILQSAIPFSLDKKPRLNKAFNYICIVDTVKQFIRVKPKQGTWINTFLGIPQHEREYVKPHFKSQDSNFSFTENNYNVDGEKIFAITVKGIPASEQHAYLMNYKHLPSYLVFGGYPDDLFKVDLTMYR